MFNFFKITHMQAQAESLIRTQFILQYNAGLFAGDPIKSARNIVSECYRENYTKFNGNLEKVPHKLTFAICTLDYALNKPYNRDNYVHLQEKLVYLNALHGLVIEYEKGYYNNKLTMYDKTLINKANKNLILKMDELNNECENNNELKFIDSIMSVSEEENLDTGEKDYWNAVEEYKNSNFEKSFELYKKSAKKGYPKGQYAYGAMFVRGECREVDYNKALKWYEKAARNGHLQAQKQAGLCHINITHNFEEAYAWLYVSSNRGDSESTEFLALANLRLVVDDEKLRLAKKKGKEYLTKYSK